MSLDTITDNWQLIVAIAVGYGLLLWLAMVIWTFRDIRDRTRDPFAQLFSVLVVLAFNLPGLLLYLIVRPKETLAEAYERSLEEEALLQELEDQRACPSCKRRVQEDFIMCPYCQFQLKDACENCEKPLSHNWLGCPYCGAGRRAAAAIERPQQPTLRSAVSQGSLVEAQPDVR
ncbi:MAG: zinc ribbon domain-containing protein [Dehalococcoidia bacterium]